MSLEVRVFHSPVDNKDYLFQRNGFYSSLSVVGEGSSSVEPKILQTKYNSTSVPGGGWIVKRNLVTGATHEIITEKALIDSAEQDASGIKRGYMCADNATMTRHIKINDCGTKLDLLVKDGKVMKLGKDGVLIAEDLSKVSNATRTWLKRFIEVVGRIK